VITFFFICYAVMDSGALMCNQTPLPADQAARAQVNLNDWDRFDPRSSRHTPWFLVPAADPLKELR